MADNSGAYDRDVTPPTEGELDAALPPWANTPLSASKASSPAQGNQAQHLPPTEYSTTTYASQTSQHGAPPVHSNTTLAIARPFYPNREGAARIAQAPENPML